MPTCNNLRTSLDANTATGTSPGGVGNTTAYPGFYDQGIAGGTGSVNATSKVVNITNANQKAIIPVWNQTHLSSDQRLHVRFTYDSTRPRHSLFFRNGSSINGTTTNGRFVLYMAGNDKIYPQGWTSNGSGEAQRGTNSPALNFVHGQKYDMDIEFTGSMATPTLTVTVNNYTTGSNVPHNFNAGSNVWSQTFSGIYSANPDGSGVCGILTDNSDYELIEYYDNINSAPTLVVPTPVASSITYNSATLSVAATGGTGTLSYNWEITNGSTWSSAGLPNAATVNLTGLSGSTPYNYRVTVTDQSTPTPQSGTNGVIFTTSAAPTNIALTFHWVFGPNNDVYITANPTGGTGSYNFAWSKVVETGSGAVTIDPATANSQTVHITCTDSGNFHRLNLIASDATGKTWPYNTQGYHGFTYPVKPYLNLSNVILRPTGTPTALPLGMKLTQQGDSNSQFGSPTSVATMASVLSALKGVVVTGTVLASGYGSNIDDSLAAKAAAAAQMQAEGVTDTLLRIGYNDQTYTGAQIAAKISTLAQFYLDNNTSQQRIWLLPTFARATSNFNSGGSEVRLEALMAGLSALDNGNTIRFCSTIDYYLTQSDRAGIYADDEQTHLIQAGLNKAGNIDANNLLSLAPVAANTPQTNVAAGSSIQFIFPVPGTIAQQAITWSVAKLGGGAAYGSIDSTGKYTAPSSVSGSATDVVTATSALGAIATVNVSMATVVAAPTLTVLAGNAHVLLKWTAVSGATGYELELNGGSATDVASALQYLDTTLTNGISRTYRIRSYDSGGTRSAWSDLQTTTPNDPAQGGGGDEETMFTPVSTHNTIRPNGLTTLSRPATATILKMQCLSPETNLRYTLDGSDPTASHGFILFSNSMINLSTSDTTTIKIFSSSSLIELNYQWGK